jgi:hypothetical protein
MQDGSGRVDHDRSRRMNRDGGMATPLERPATPTQVIACLICKRWHPSIAFYNGSKACRRIGADLIRQTIAALRTRRSLPVEVRVLVETIDVTADDHECERTWRNAIDALRVLYHASAIGTGREKSLLLDVARNRRLVAGMRLASRFSKDIPHNWLAVFRKPSWSRRVDGMRQIGDCSEPSTAFQAL